ncbi:hypothetical protein BS78_05G065700 [Paspalum vaginatum]|nr:hypothetical protein BS78_05G065700 [Paspalum vaginatum]
MAHLPSPSKPTATGAANPSYTPNELHLVASSPDFPSAETRVPPPPARFLASATSRRRLAWLGQRPRAAHQCRAVARLTGYLLACGGTPAKRPRLRARWPWQSPVCKAPHLNLTPPSLCL